MEQRLEDALAFGVARMLRIGGKGFAIAWVAADRAMRAMGYMR